MKGILLLLVGGLILLGGVLYFDTTPSPSHAVRNDGGNGDGYDGGNDGGDGSLNDGGDVDRPAFAVRVEKPRRARPLMGLLPTALEAKLAGHGDLVFDDASPGARIEALTDDRVALHADGWALTLETDPDGTVSSETQLVFPIMLANRPRTLRCRPTASSHASQRNAARVTSPNDAREQTFRVELSRCENTDTGRVIEWPPAPLVVTGFVRHTSDGPATPESGVPDPDE